MSRSRFAAPSPRLAVLALVATIALALLASLASPADAAARGCGRSADLRPDRSAASLATTRRAVLCLLNVERRARGLGALRAERRLRLAARRHSAHMVARRFFDHVSPGGSTMVSRIAGAGYRRSVVLGENLAWGDGRHATPRSVVAAWMRSPGHRANILNRRFREVGVGVALGTPRGTGPGRATYTTDFGRRR